jgi:phage recombination protein Bet
MNARTTAIARQDENIQNNVAKIEAARKPSALDVMASRLNVSANGLKQTLLNTVFRNAKDDEFVALIIVANAYGLNPLTKEIYAFPAKGGGIVPVVSIDGWLRIMNEHPQFDGIEFEDISDDDGQLYAVEAVIYRKDRTRPIKVTEYLEECRQNTDPWKKLPARMLRHKATIQCARYAFGFSGIASEGDEEAIGDIRLVSDAVPPMRSANRIEQREVAHDRETGEVLDERTEQEIAEELDRETEAQREGRTDEQHGDQHPGDEPEAYQELVDGLIGRVINAEVMGDIISAATEFDKHRKALPDNVCKLFDGKVAASKKALGK